jgi:hypothetical protein
MNFTELLSKMQELDKPVTEPTMAEQPLEDCGMPGPMSSPISKPDTPPPSVSINLNAQGLDNIEELMKLVAKVNPDMDKPSMPPLPSMGAEPSILSIKPSMPPLKMLPDMDAGNDEMPGGEKDKGSQPGGLGASLDRDGDGDHDMKDHDMEKKDKDEAFANSLGDSEPNTMDVDAAIPDGNDLHKAKKSYSDKPYRGDNPMAVEGQDLRSQIRADLLRRLEEAKAK